MYNRNKMYKFSENIVKIVRQPKISYIVINKNNTFQPTYQLVNETAITIFECINKNYSFNMIINVLKNKYKENENIVRKKTMIFINDLLKYKTISINNKNIKNNIPMIGSCDYYTPEYMIIELTSLCLLNCKHCYLGKNDNISINNDSLKLLLNDIVKLGVNNVQLSGGEPLLFKEINNVLSFLIDKNIKTSVTTSGYIDDDLYNKILPVLRKLHKVNGNVQVSIDGNSKIHNFIRGKSDSFERAKKLIIDLIKNNIIVNTAMVVHEYNIDYIETVAKIVKSWGVNVHRITGFMKAGNAYNLININPLKLKKIINNISNVYSDNHFHITTIEENINAIKGRITPNCGCGSLTITIDPSLNVLPCPMIRNEKRLFNLNEINLENGLKVVKDYYHDIEAPSEKKCGICEKLITCNGCIAEGIIEFENNEKCLWK